MNNYYYIIASLPELTTGWKFGDKDAEWFISEIKERCSDKDIRLIEWIERGFEPENLTEEFYAEAVAHPSAFIREYYTFDLNVRNAKVRYLNKALSRPAEKDVINIPVPEFEDAAKMDAILQNKDILERERDIDDLYWDKLDSLSELHYFDMNVILAFIVKLHIIDRWHLLDEQTGREMFKKLVDEIRGTFRGVRYDG